MPEARSSELVQVKAGIQALVTRHRKELRALVPVWKNYEAWLKFELFRLLRVSRRKDSTGIEIPYSHVKGKKIGNRPHCDLFLGPVAFDEKRRLWYASGPGAWFELKSLLKSGSGAVEADVIKLRKHRPKANRGRFVVVSMWAWWDEGEAKMYGATQKTLAKIAATPLLKAPLKFVYPGIGRAEVDFASVAVD